MSCCRPGARCNATTVRDQLSDAGAKARIAEHLPPDLGGTAGPIKDYLAALRLLEGVAVDVLVPGHGSVGGADQVRVRIDQDRAYVHALRDGRDPSDPRIGPSAKPGWEWVSDVHNGQAQRLARRSEHHGTPG